MTSRPAPLVLLCLLCLLCTGCAASRPPGSQPLSADAANGQALATAIGTPFYALFKATTCAVSTVIAVPSTAALALTARPDRAAEQEAMYAGLGHNCFGSYALEPI